MAHARWRTKCFSRGVGQQLVKLLAEITVDGYVFRVDLRLRPFGSAGRVALSFAAMEQYYQREGRDWERYAWIKARPVAGDIAAGKRLIEMLRPFVYRRYLDYTAFAGLREMKALIDAEVARKDLAQHLKLGPGGIREIEFIVQLLQLIRGGREPGLRERGLLPALGACERIGALGDGQRKTPARGLPACCASSRTACRCCATSRRTNCRKTHSRARAWRSRWVIRDWAALEVGIGACARDDVSEEFAALMAPVARSETVRVDDRSAACCVLAAPGRGRRQCRRAGWPWVLPMPKRCTRKWSALLASPTLRTLSARARARCFERLLPTC